MSLMGCEMMKRPYPFPLVLVVALLLAGCGRANRNELTIKMEAMHFLQNEVEAKVGQPITLHLVNKDGYAHAFDMDAFDVHTLLAANEKLTITFTPERTGSYPFYCSSPGHEMAGMVGTLMVIP